MNICLRCGKGFKRNTHLLRHLKKIKICPPEFLEIPRVDIIYEYEKFYNQYLLVKNTKAVSQNPKSSIINSKSSITNPKSSITTPTENCPKKLPVISCSKCGKEFKYLNNFYRHQKHFCGVIKAEEKKTELMKEYLDTKYEVLKIEYESKLEEYEGKQEEDEKEKDALTEKVEELETKIAELNQTLVLTNQQNTVTNTQNNQNTENDITTNSNNTNANNTNNSNNTNSNNTQINNTQINIKINDFGQEDLSKITRREWMKIISTLYQSLPGLIYKIHIDMDENRNIYLPNTKEKYGLVYKDERWILKEIKDIIEEVIRNNLDRLYDFIEDNKEELDTKVYRKVDEMIDKTINEKYLQEYYKDKVKLILLNNRHLIKEFYETVFQKKLDSSGKKLIKE